MWQLSQEGATAVARNGFPKSRYVFVIISAIFFVIASVALLNIASSFSTLMDGIERLDKAAFEVGLKPSVNTIDVSIIAKGEVAKIAEPGAISSFALSQRSDDPSLIQKSTNPEGYLENDIVPGIRDLDVIIYDLFQSKGVAARGYLDELWRRAGDLEVPNDALVALKHIAMGDDENLAKRAEFALSDLTKYKARLEKEKYQKSVTLNASNSQNVSPDKYALDTTRISNITTRMSNINNDVLIMDDVRAMLDSHDEIDRSLAVDKLNLLRSPGALSLLIEVSNQDYDAKIRHKAIRGIWMHVADGIDNSTQGLELLQQAAYDADQSIASLARSALDDLTKQRSAAH